MTERTCSIDGCGKPHRARGLCTMHYQRWAVNGDPLVNRCPRDRVCSIDGCGRKHSTGGLCKRHYRMATAPARDTCSVPGCEAKAGVMGPCPRHNSRIAKYGTPIATRPPSSLGCSACDILASSPDLAFAFDEAPTFVAKGLAIGCSRTTAAKHVNADHDNDPAWHAARAEWWINELETARQMLPGGPS